MIALHQKQNKKMKCKVKDNHPSVRARVNLLLVSLVIFLVFHATSGWGQDNFGAISRGSIRIRDQYFQIVNLSVVETGNFDYRKLVWINDELSNPLPVN